MQSVKNEPGVDGTEWDEEQLEQALQHLKQLHVKVADLRKTIPRMLESIALKQDTPKEVYDTFTYSVKAANNEIQEFDALYKGEQSRQVFDHAKTSREANPTGIKSWRKRDHEDWYFLEDNGK